MVRNTGLSAPAGEHPTLKRGRKPKEFHVLPHGGNDDVARAWRYHQHVPIKDTGLGASSYIVGSQRRGQAEDSIYLLMVSCYNK
jgi:hypothetical protein